MIAPSESQLRKESGLPHTSTCIDSHEIIEVQQAATATATAIIARACVAES